MGFTEDYENGLDDIDLNELKAEEEAFKSKIKKEVSKFNKYEDKSMDVLFYRAGFVGLYIDENLITEGDELDIYERVRQINREHGLNYFDKD